MTGVTFLVDVDMSLTSSGMWLIWRRCPSGSLAMIPSRMFCYWGCVSGVDPSVHTITFPLVITEVVVVLCNPYLGGSTGDGCFLYIVVWWFSICDTWSYWYQTPTICLYNWPDRGWINQQHSLWGRCIHSTSCTGRGNHVLVIIPSMVLHYYLSVLAGHYLSHFHRICCVGSPVAVIIHPWLRFQYPVAMYGHRITCISLLTQLNCIMDSWYFSSSYSTLSIM